MIVPFAQRTLPGAVEFRIAAALVIGKRRGDPGPARRAAALTLEVAASSARKSFDQRAKGLRAGRAAAIRRDLGVSAMQWVPLQQKGEAPMPAGANRFIAMFHICTQTALRCQV